MTNAYSPNPARPVLAAEINDTLQTYKPGSNEQSPRYALLPSGLDANRVRFSGTLTEADEVPNTNGYYRGRLVGPTGAVYVYAGDNSPEPRAYLQNTNPPEYVTVKGKITPFEGNDGERRVKIAPETITTVSADERHRTVANAASNLVNRLRRLVEDGETSGRFDAQVYKEQYGPDHFQQLDYLDPAIKAIEDVDNAVGQDAADPVPDKQQGVGRAD